MEFPDSPYIAKYTALHVILFIVYAIPKYPCISLMSFTSNPATPSIILIYEFVKGSKNSASANN